MWRGRAAEIVKGQARAQRVFDARIRSDLRVPTERELARGATEDLRAVRLFRLGRGPRRD